MSEKARILIVDDEKQIRDSVSELLIDNGYSTGAAASGEEALTKLKEESFDIALVDVKMPKMSGLQLLEKIKTDQPRVDLIMITGYATVNMAAEALKLGAYDFLQKPCDNNEMLASIKRLLDKRRLEDELKQVKYYHELILQSAGEGIIGIDLEGKHMFVNPAAAKKLGYEVAELLGQPSHTMWHHSKPDGTPYPKEECPVDAAYKGRTIYTRDDEVFWRKDGTSFPVRYTTTPIWEEDKLLGAVIIFRDITERKKAEEELKASEARFRNLVEATTDWVWEVDAQGIYTYASPKIKDILGYEVSEVVGKTPFDLMPEEEAEKTRNFFEQKAIKKEPFSRLENMNLHKDGHLVVLETSGIPIFDGKGLLKGYRGIDRDITERKQIEAALRDSEEKFRNISAAAKDAIIMLDNDGNITYWNKAAEEIFGYTQGEVLGKEAHTILAHERYHKAFRKGFSIFKETGQGPVVGKTQELSALKKDGSEFTIELSVSAVKIQGKWHSIGIARDITDRKRYEESLLKTTEELKRLDEIKSEFISTASHELRTPLASIKIAVGFILSRKTGEITDTQEKFLSMGARNINRLSAIIDDLLDISRIESGKIQLNYTEVDIKNIIENVINTFRALANEKSLALNMNLAPELPPIYTDAFRLEQVLINLVNNAIKFTPAGGKISVQARLTSAEFGMRNAELNSEIANPQSGIDRNFIEISVTDTGIGIPEEHVKHLFEKFYQVEASLSVKRPSGTGLGLAISEGLVNALGGKIQCKSKEGEGSTFSFTLPIIAAEKRFSYMLKNELAKAKQHHLPLSVLIIKLEDFAQVKEVYGIKECKRDLELVKEKIEKKGLKFADKINVSRYNGEIIALIIMPDTSCNGAQVARERIKTYLTGLEIARGESKYSCSFVSGVATYPDDGSSAKELLDFAMEGLEKKG